jgi:hypothetical protein
VGGQFRRHLAVDRIQVVVGVGALQVREGRDTRASSWPDFSIATMVLSKVGAAWLLAIASISSRLLAHADFEGRLEVLVLDLVEGRIVERQRAGA